MYLTQLSEADGGIHGAGGQGSDIIVNALIQVAGYPSEDVACLAVPFWQTFSHLSSQNIMQVCTISPSTLHNAV